MTVRHKDGRLIDLDNLIHPSMNPAIAKLSRSSIRLIARLPPTSSPLTDGAAAVVVMQNLVQKSLGLRPWPMQDYAFPALDPENMLLGNVYACPEALKKRAVQWMISIAANARPLRRGSAIFIALTVTRF